MAYPELVRIVEGGGLECFSLRSHLLVTVVMYGDPYIPGKRYTASQRHCELRTNGQLVRSTQCSYNSQFAVPLVRSSQWLSKPPPIRQSRLQRAPKIMPHNRNANFRMTIPSKRLRADFYHRRTSLGRITKW